MERLSDKQKWECSEHDQKEWICATDGERFFHMKRYGWDKPEKNNEEHPKSYIELKR